MHNDRLACAKKLSWTLLFGGHFVVGLESLKLFSNLWTHKRHQFGAIIFFGGSPDYLWSAFWREKFNYFFGTGYYRPSNSSSIFWRFSLRPWDRSTIVDLYKLYSVQCTKTWMVINVIRTHHPTSEFSSSSVTVFFHWSKAKGNGNGGRLSSYLMVWGAASNIFHRLLMEGRKSFKRLGDESFF